MQYKRPTRNYMRSSPSLCTSSRKLIDGQPSLQGWRDAQPRVEALADDLVLQIELLQHLDLQGSNSSVLAPHELHGHGQNSRMRA